MKEFDKLYQVADPSLWDGRVDGQELCHQRWHQAIDCIDLKESIDLKDAVVLLGFCCDEGVRRNQGREGAKFAPDYLRKVLSNLPVSYNPAIKLYDAGNIGVSGYDMESSQQALSQAVYRLKSMGAFPVVLGGGHEMSYAHFQGLVKQNDKRVGIINIDAHVDMRELADGAGNSGTSFYQIQKDLSARGESFAYLAIGIQQVSNTVGLLQYAESKGAQLIYAHEISYENLDNLRAKIELFSQEVDQLYLSIDMDAFSAAFAPGVSALSYNGIIPDPTFLKLLRTIYQHPKLVSLDFAELNPRYDLDERTAKLTSSLIFEFLKRF